MRFHKTMQDFEVLWSGESSVVGNIKDQPSLWGYIKGPGPNDFVTFPQSGTMSWVQNSILPQTKVPAIALISDNGGTQPIEKNTLTRTQETLSITGEGMGSAKAIEIMDGDRVLQRIMPMGQYIVSTQQIDLPPGIINLEAEGSARQIRVWNELGPSILSEQKFNIETGLPILTSTTSDQMIHDRARHLELTGYGFKSKTADQAQLTHIRVDDENGNAVYDNGLANSGTSDGLPLEVTRLEVVSDTLALLPQDTIGSAADGTGRRLRVSRQTVASAQDVGSVLSPPTNPLFTAITAQPVVTSVQQLNAMNNWEDVLVTGMFKRDRVLELNGTGLNTVSTLEVVQEDGTSFANPVFIQLPNAGVTVEDNGTRLLMNANTLPWSDADTNSSAKRTFKLYNGVGNTDLNASQTFAVNIQPKVDAIGGFAQPGYFNRDKILGDDLLIYGSGLQAVSQVVFTDANDTTQTRLTLDVPSPGITVTDSRIEVDTQVYQLGSGADTDQEGAQRILKLISAREDAWSSMNWRYRVGIPPTITSVGGIGGDGNYSRDLETLSVTGTGFGHVSKLEIVDTNGNPITGVLGLGDNTGFNRLNATSLSVDANATGWVNVVHLLDTVNAGGRRVRVSTPFGVVTSAEGFTVSAKPELPATSQATFAGGGYDGGTNVYDRSEGDLYISGNHLRGVKQVVFYVGGVSQGSITMDPKSPPLGVIVNGEGTRIFLDDSILPAGWIGSSTATIGLISVAGTESKSTIITTQE